jgi:hypothetical protein
MDSTDPASSNGDGTVRPEWTTTAQAAWASTSTRIGGTDFGLVGTCGQGGGGLVRLSPGEAIAGRASVFYGLVNNC